MDQQPNLRDRTVRFLEEKTRIFMTLDLTTDS